jgi:hypothetical protein
MNHFAGLDVSVKETSVCIVDDTGTLCRSSDNIVPKPDRVADLERRQQSLEERTCYVVRLMTRWSQTSSAECSISERIFQFWAKSRLICCHLPNDSADLEQNSLLNGTGHFCEGTGNLKLV